MKKYIYSLIFFTVTGLMFSCDDEDFTGDSTLTPSSPSISVTAPNTTPFIEQDTAFTFTVTLSEPQIVDVAVYIFQSGGTATAGSDFTFTNRVVIPAYRTSAVGAIEIMADEVIEDTETIELTFGDHRTANASITPVTTSFTIQDYDEDALALSLEWSTPTLFDSDGNELAATDVVDLIFTLVDVSTETEIAVEDGAGFESMDILSTLPDGEYELRVSIFGSVSTGDLGTDDYDVDLMLSYSQVGVQTGSISKPTALNTMLNCVESDYVVIAILDKTGSNYTVTESDEKSFALEDTDAISGSYTELNNDGASPQTATVTMTAPDANGLFTISNFAFSSAWWCGHTGAEIDLVLDGSEVTFPDGGAGTEQAVRGMGDLCGYAGPVVVLNEVGSWNPCSGEIVINIEVTVDAGSFGDTNLTYTPQ